MMRVFGLARNIKCRKIKSLEIYVPKLLVKFNGGQFRKNL